ncbi:glutathione S-transferase kappa 1 [Erpetoichthys calabaricus]|uniref:Glutathione S-transferase kappa n=1 Tax=Erpetoichthys calabaricus TaxID=27687 RepID=A0A8C4S5E8_ERPCA|nr:glutathione S-transferase kappa 1 [Erpetoichthys calabaricus]
MSASKKLVELFYDVVSPYSWIGFEILCRYRNVWNIDVRLRPGFLGGVMQGAENKPPGFVPRKFEYMKKDLHRLGCYFNIPLAQPQNPAEVMFVKGTLQAMRFVTATNILQPELTEVLSRELWMRIWSRDEDITEPASFQAVATAIGLSKDQAIKLIEFSKSQEVKDSLKSTTQEALDNGAFGFPFIIAHVNSKKEVFFGSDRMELLAHCLGEKWLGPLTSNSKSKI